MYRTSFAILLVCILAISSLAFNSSDTYQDLETGETSLTEFRGKLLLVEAFSTSCGHCEDQHPVLEEIYQDYQDDIYLLSISISSQDTVQTVEDFNSTFPSSWNVGLDSSDFFTDSYGIWGTPTFLLFSAEGEFGSCTVGQQSKDQLTQMLDSALEDIDAYTQENSGDGECERRSGIDPLSSIFLIAVIVYVAYYFYNRRKG